MIVYFAAGIFVLAFNRPHAKNALSRNLMAQVRKLEANKEAIVALSEGEMITYHIAGSVGMELKLDGWFQHHQS